MTTNQIAYFKAKVEEQHYKNQDAETQRHNVEQERLGYGTLVEQSRHNVATENETALHNRNTENIQYGNLVELARHNTTTENEASRHNLTTEGQTDFVNNANVMLTSGKALAQDWDNYLNLKYGEIERVNSETNSDRMATVRLPSVWQTNAIKTASMSDSTTAADNMIQSYRAANGLNVSYRPDTTNVGKEVVKFVSTLFKRR